MAEGSRFTLYYVKEAESGVTPANAQLKTLRLTTSDLGLNINGLESAELRDDAETSDYRLGARHVTGTVNSEMSFGTFDELIAAVLRSEWKPDGTVTGATLRQSFTMIDYNADLPDEPYTIYRGCEINSMTMTVSAEAITMLEFGIVGRTSEMSATLPPGATVLERTTTKPMDGFAGRLAHDDVEVANITEITVQIENGIEPRFVVGSKFSIKPGAKRRAVSGTMNTYFEDNSLRKKYLNENEVSIEFDLIDPDDAGKKYTVMIPRCKFTEAPHPVEGEGDIMLNISYRGLLDTKADGIKSSIRIVKAGDTGDTGEG